MSDESPFITHVVEPAPKSKASKGDVGVSEMPPLPSEQDEGNPPIALKATVKENGDHGFTGYGSSSFALHMILMALFIAYGASALSMLLLGKISISDPFVQIWSSVSLCALLIVIYRICRIYRERSHERLLLKELFDGSVSVRFVTDIGNRCIYSNMRFMDLHIDGERGLKALDVMFAHDAAVLERFHGLVENAQRGAFETIELPGRSSTGEEIWVSIAAQPIAGRAGWIHWRVTNVTERHNIEALVSEERAKLLDFTDNAPVGFFSVDQDGRFIFVNATMARWFGMGIDELLAEGRLHTFLEEPPENARPFDLFDGAGAKQVCEIKMKGPGGRVFLASVSQSVVHEAEDRVRTRAVVHDLTAEREMRQALKDSEDRFQRFFEEAPLGIVLVNDHGVINDCNPTFARMLGMKVRSLEGCEFESLIADEYKLEVVKAIADIEEGGRLDTAIDLMLKADEREVYAQMHARKFKGKSIVLHLVDITDQKSLEAQFAQSQKMQAIGQLAGGVAHDFNNLLTAMIGFCDLLLLRHKAGDPSFNDIMQIKQNANRAANLVRQLLAFSRQQTLQPRVLDVTDTLTEVSHLLRRLIGVGIEFKLDHDPDIGLIKADEGQFEQVLINLAVNARDAMDNTGELLIKTTNFTNKRKLKRGSDTMPAGEWVVIEVRDTGCGISDEVLERIFEPFFTTKEIGSGTGLGLATVHGIVRQTGGYIHVDSEAGKGTSFFLYMPRHEPSDDDSENEEGASKGDEAAAAEDLTGNATILLVEDEDAVRSFGARALRNKGYDVLEAACAEDALDLLEKDAPKLDLMITDVIMPEMDGPTLAHKVLAMTPELPVIFVSGYTEDRYKDEFDGFNVHFLPKPFTLQLLAEKVKNVMGGELAS